MGFTSAGTVPLIEVAEKVSIVPGATVPVLVSVRGVLAVIPNLAKRWRGYDVR